MTILSEPAVERRAITIPTPPWATMPPSHHASAARTWAWLGKLPEATTYLADTATNLMAAQAAGTIDTLGAYARLTALTGDLVALLAVALDLPIEGES